MTNKTKIELVRANHGGQTQATDSQILEIANTMPAGTLEKYQKMEKAKVKTDAD